MLAAALLLACADTVRVTGGDAAALRAALAFAPAGRVVVVAQGRYEGGLVLDRPVTLVGEGRPLLWAGGLGTVVRITAPGVALRGFHIAGSGRNLDRDDAGVRIEADSAALDDLILGDVLHGVYLLAVHHVAIRRVTIRGRAGERPNDRGDGIHFYRSSHILADGNDIADVRDGMYFSYSDTTVVRGNTVTRSRYGLHYMFSHANRFEDNVFTHSAAGSSIMNSRDVVARGNLFAFNRGSGSFGLLLQTTERTVLERNRFVGNAVGLFLDGVVRGEVRDNLIAGNFVGIQLFQSTTETVVTGNDISGNMYGATGAATLSRFCDNGRGNRWSGDDGWDLDGDGVHDAAYSPASPLTELSRERPALRLYLASPAATVLGWAERTFPVFRLDAVRDDCPLAVASAGVPLPPAPERAPRAARAGAWLAASMCLGLGAGLTALATPWRHA